MLIYRDATTDDLAYIVEVYNSTVAGRMVTADTEPVSIHSRQRWFNEHDPQHRPLWIVYHSSCPVGWVSFQWFYGRPAYKATSEISIYLDERERGKGFGKEILSYAVQSCSRLGIKTLLGYIFAHNQPSIKLFRSQGFDIWGNFPRVANLDGIERDLIIMGKRVNE